MEIDNVKAYNVKDVEKMMIDNRIGLIITTDYNPLKDYRIRRLAADLLIPMVLNHKLGYELSKSLYLIESKDVELKVKDLKMYWVDYKDIIKIL